VRWAGLRLTVRVEAAHTHAHVETKMGVTAVTETMPARVVWGRAHGAGRGRHHHGVLRLVALRCGHVGLC